MSVVSPHRGDRDGLARGLGLRGIPTRNLVEFEGGGSMLCRQVLGEMLAANEQGVGALKVRGVTRTRTSNISRGKREGLSSTTRWAEEACDGGVAEEGRRVRLLCQADALAWLRESSAQTNSRWPVTDRTAMLTQRGRNISGHNDQLRLRDSGHNDQQQLVLRGWSKKDDRVVVDDHRATRAAVISASREEARRSPSPCSPTKRKRQPPVKLYDHVHNPRVLRALVDDTVITGIAGAGALMAEEDRRIEDLRLQLRLACHRATELQDQMFQSQTGAPHRELLGELELDRTRSRSVGAQRRPNGSQRNTRSDFAFAAEEGAEASIDLPDRCARSRSGGRSQQHLMVPSTSGERAPTEAATSMTSEGFSSARRSTVPACRPRKAQQRVAGSCHGQIPNDSDSPFSRQSGTRLPVGLGSKSTQWGKSMPEVVTTCNPPLPPLLTPTTSLRRYLSSLRPFSAGSARAAWGLAEPWGGTLHGQSDRRWCQDIDGTFESGQRRPRWPVLFVMGGAKPSARHPLDVHSLPFFDDAIVALLARASGEPVEKVLAMTQVLSRFDFHLLQAAVKRLCCANTAGEAALARPSARGRGWFSGRSGALASDTQAHVRREGGPMAGAAAALGSRIVEGQELCSEPVIISEVAAEQVLTGGFLCGVFGDGAVRDIISASRPVVVFDSVEAAGVATSPVEKSVSAKGRTSCDRHVDLATRNYSRQQSEDDDGSRGRSGDVSGDKPVTVTSHGNGSPSPLQLPKEPKQEKPSEEGHPLGAINTSALISPVESSSRRADSTPGRQMSGGGEGVLVTQLVRATAARFRVHSLAVRHRDSGDPGRSSSSFSSSFSQSRGALHPLVGRDLFCGGFDRTGLGEDERRRRRPASAGSDELGLPPLKLVKRAKSRGGPRSAWAPCGHGGGERGRHSDINGEKEEEEHVDVSGVQSSRSTPRCLRPGFKGEVTAAMLRKELEVSENTAARIGISMARKTEAWKIETQEEGITAATTTAAAANRAALDLASENARTALLEATQSCMRDAMSRMHLGVLRRRWNAWRDLTRRQRSLEAAERVTRLVGAAALTSGVLEPLLRRRMRAWLHRWAAAMRAGRVVEVQAAAIELQRTVRGFLGKAHARGRRYAWAATEIQRVSRGRAGRARGARRARVLKESRAVQIIERKFCEVVWQRDAAKLMKFRQRERAATGLQASWRGLVCGQRRAKFMRKARREEVSVVMLQRLWRGVIAREKADALMEAKRQRQAATRIQAIARGRQARHVYCPIILRERSAAKLSRFWRCAQAKKLARHKRARLRLATLVNPYVRGFLARVATRTIREERCRRQSAMFLASIATQKIFRGKQGRLKARRELLQKCAAVELQRAARKYLMRRLSSVEDQQQRRNLATWMAAIGVQRMWRGLQGRRKFGQREAEERRWSASFTIQSAYRRARKRRRKREKAQARKTAAVTKSALSADDRKIVGAENQGELAGRADSNDHLPDGSDRAEDISSQSERAVGGGGDGVEVANGIAGVGPSGDGGQGGRAGAFDGKKADHGGAGDGAAADTSDKDTVPISEELEDIGDVALAAISLSRRPMAEVAPPMSPSTPSPAISDRGAASESSPFEAGPVGLPPGWELTLEYYEAKSRYLAAQQAAHGASAAKIQAMYRAFVARREMVVIRANRDEFKRRRLEEARATIVIQSGIRGRAARRVAAAKRAAIVDAARRETGLLIIQCAVRCFLGKCRLRHLIEARQAKRDMLDRMAVKIQARVRGAQTREVWRKFFKSRALLKRERQRKGAQQIQASWRSKLARTEAERRRSVRDAALLAQELERHLKSVLEAAMEAERKHAYAVRLQCWWRGILAVRTKTRTRRSLNETPLAEVEGGQESAAIAIQCHWRAFKARRSYYDNYASLFRERERKKYCTECQGDYATRKCQTCLDKFCDSCWARIHSKGARRFHHWEPFATFSYEASYGQQGAPRSGLGSTVDDTGYYDYAPDWNGGAEGWAEGLAEGSGGVYGGLEEGGAGKGGVGGELLAIEPEADPNTAYGQVSDYYGDNYYTGSESYDYPGSEYGNQSWYGSGGGGGDQPLSSSLAVDVYGGAATYDGASGSHFSGLTQDTSASYTFTNAGDNDDAWGSQSYGYGSSSPDVYGGGGDGGGQEGWAVATTPTPQDWYGGGSGVASEVADYYGYDSAATYTAGGQASSGEVDGGGAAVATDWNRWAAPDAGNGTSGRASISSYSSGIGGGGGRSGGGGNTSGTDGGASGGRTTTSSSGGGAWSVNEFGQRVCGNWVEYWDESVQAAYFYNTATGEASWTEPATG